MSDYIICTRNIKNNEFGNEPGKAVYLKVPDTLHDYSPNHKVSLSEFLEDVINTPHEDIVFFVHGYNTTTAESLVRHRLLKKGLAKNGFKGDVITFAWPSGDKPLLYLEDRHDSKNVAMELVYAGIALLAKQQGKNCTMNVHTIAHSTGAYIIQEAFNDSDTTRSTAEINWAVSQMLFIGGDVSSDSMCQQYSGTIYRHCARVTNYYNPFDSILAISNVKRVGAKNRVGRIGLPLDVPSKAVDVNCGLYYETNKQHIKVVNGAHSHSWYFYSNKWMKDAAVTLMAKIDRNVFPTRIQETAGGLVLKPMGL